MRASLIGWMVLVSACGGDDRVDVPECTVGGGGTVEGSVLGYEVDPVVRANAFVHPDVPGAFVVLLDEVDADCFEAPASGEHLVLGWDGPQPEVGAYDVGALEALGLVESGAEGDIAAATTGQIEIERSDAACVAGRFAIAFDADAMSGVFAAQRCD